MCGDEGKRSRRSLGRWGHRGDDFGPFGNAARTRVRMASRIAGGRSGQDERTARISGVVHVSVHGTDLHVAIPCFSGHSASIGTGFPNWGSCVRFAPGAIPSSAGSGSRVAADRPHVLGGGCGQTRKSLYALNWSHGRKIGHEHRTHPVPERCDGRRVEPRRAVPDPHDRGRPAARVRPDRGSDALHRLVKTGGQWRMMHHG